MEATTNMESTNQEGICPDCGKALVPSTSNRNRGKYRRCVVCYNRDHLKRWYAKNRDYAIAKAKDYYQQTRPRRLEIARENYNAMSPEAKSRYIRDGALKHKYGISLEEYERMFTAQNGLCFLCHKPAPSGKRLNVDHCHKDGMVRKLLCGRCNTFLIIIENDPEWVTRAVQYLNSYSKGD